MNKNLAIDINEVMNFVFDSSTETQNDVVSMFGTNEKGELELQNKQCTESKNVQNDTKINVKYDFIKNLLGLVWNADELTTMSIGENIAFNSLYQYGFIKVIENKEKEDE